MADNTSRREGLTRFNTTKGDVAGKSASLIDKVDLDRGMVVLRGVEAGTGVTLDLVDADGFAGTEGKKLIISVNADGGAGPAGPAGKDGKDGANGTNGLNGTNGVDGKDGATGPKGNDGATGAAGRGITSTAINGSGNLVLTYTDGSTADVGHVVGATGAKGADGATGTKGADGATGAAGRGITSSTINGSGNLVLTFTDGSTADVGHVVGAAGPKGDNGLVSVSSVGGGIAVVNSFASGALALKTLAQGAGITLSETGGLITITATSTGTGGTGSASFIGLSDVPSTFTGAANKFTKVNSAGTALVFGGVAASEVTGLATVASTGSYADLSNKPTIPAAVTKTSQLTNDSGFVTSAGAVSSVAGRTGDVVLTANDVSGLAAVAKTGAYSDLTGKPTLFSGSYTDLTNKPTLVTTLAALTDVNTAGAANGSILKYDSASSKWIVAAAPGGTGTVTAVSSTTNAIVVATSTTTPALTFTPANVDKNTLGGSALTVANGGTGISSLAAKGLLFGNGTNAVGSVTAPTTAGTVLSYDGTNFVWTTPASGGGSGGTVTSVALALPTTVFDVTGSPITTSGTLTGSLKTQAANSVFAGPATGSTASAPSFRSLVAADLPNFPASKITSGQLALAQGGTGADLSGLNTNQLVAKGSTGALVGIAAPTTADTYLKWDGSSFSWSAVSAASGSGVAVQQNGTTVVNGATTVNFTGAGVAVSNVGGVPTVNIPGGAGGGQTIYKFRIGYSSANVNVVDNLPAGWTSTNTTTDVTITHNQGKMVFGGWFYGATAAGANTYKSRVIGTSTGGITQDFANLNVFTLTAAGPSITGAASNSECWVYFTFM